MSDVLNETELGETRKPAYGCSGGDRIVCVCFGLSENAILKGLAERDGSVDKLVEDTGMGTRCTACRIDVDLLVGAGLSDDPVNVLSREQSVVPEGDGWIVPADHLNSCFFVQDGKISTSLRVVNRGQLFDENSPLSDYDWQLELIDSNGKTVHRDRGYLGRQQDLTIDFAAIPNCPPRGWFMISLAPRTYGLSGTVRPQVHLRAPGWASTVHAQYVIMAWRRRSVMVRSDANGRLNCIFPVLNIEKTPAKTEVILIPVAPLPGQGPVSAFATVPGFGIDFIEIDRKIGPLPPHQMYVASIVTDVPTRRYIINQHAQGSWCVDHFPATT